MILIKSWVSPKDQKFESDWENVQIEKQRRLGFDGKIKNLARQFHRRNRRIRR